MRKQVWKGLALVALLAAGFHALPLVYSGDAKKDAKGKELEDHGKAAANNAGGINFAKELGLSFNSLANLGARIDEARNHSDPICLAVIARELAVAEKVSNKHAGITAEQIAKEAGDLAKMRYDPKELEAVSMLTGNKELQNIARKATQDRANAIQVAKEGTKSRGIQGQLHVDSRVPDTSINVYIDGRFVGTIPPFGDIYPYVGQTPWETTYLSARSYDGRTWNRSVGQAVGDYTWRLWP